MGKSSRRKRERKEARESKLPRGVKTGTLDDLTDEVEGFFLKAHKQVKDRIKLSVLRAKELDSEEQREMVGSGVTCTNCTAATKGCCYLSVSAFLFEALPVARLLMHEGRNTPELREKLHTAGDAMQNTTQEDWFDTQTPCVFLTEEHRCSIYSVRPTACRHHVVFSPQKNCEIGKEVKRTLQYDSSRELDIAFRWNNALAETFFQLPDPAEAGAMYLGAFPKVVARFLDAMDSEDYRESLKNQDWPTFYNPPKMALQETE